MFGKFNIANTVLVGMAQAVSVHPGRCSRMAHKKSPCNLCETNCPVGAISVGDVGSTINIDWGKCTYCGICINICPTGVYGVRELGYEGFLDTYLRAIDDNGILRLSCRELLKQREAETEKLLEEREKAREYAVESGKSLEDIREKGNLTSHINTIADIFKNNDGENALYECLGILSLPDLLYFYTKGAKTIIITVPDCSSCVNKYGGEILEEELNELEKLCPYFEHLEKTKIDVEQISKKSVITVSFSKQFEKILYVDEEQEQKQAEIVTRRGMFDLLKNNAKERMVMSAALLTPQDIPKTTPFKKTKDLSVRRTIFLDALTNCGKLLKDEKPVSAYFFSQTVQDECNMCKICTKFCPSGALHASEDGKELLFNMSLCVSCGMCLISCYYNYIKPEKVVYLKKLFEEQVKFKTE